MNSYQRNAKDELLKIVEENNLIIDNIDCYNQPIPNNDNYKYYYKSLDDLNFIYNPFSEAQILYGIVYCYDKDNNPVWLTRVKECEYAPEHWKINQIPDFYKK